jgi:hypothetical protein
MATKATSKAIKVSEWKPQINRDGAGEVVSVGDPTRYEYGPSVVIVPAVGAKKDQYVMSCTAGRNTDTISVVMFPSAPGASRKYAYFSEPERLVADPCLLFANNLWYLAYTSGDPDGKNNHIRLRTMTDAGVFGKPTLLLKPPASLFYGYGQPCLVMRGPDMFMFYTDKTTLHNRLAGLDLTTRRPIHFVEGSEDGGSADWFVTSSNEFKALQAGDGQVALRNYAYDPVQRTMTRYKGIESTVPGSTLQGYNHVARPLGVDGACIVKYKHGNLQLKNGKLECWQAGGDSLKPETWQLEKFYINAPTQ